MILGAMLIGSLTEKAASTELHEWVADLDVSSSELVAARAVDGNYFALLRNGSQLFLASRKLVEKDGVGGHRFRFEMEDSKGRSLAEIEPCAGRQIVADFEPCGDQFCDLDLTEYEIPAAFEGQISYRVRWQWITADVETVDEVHAYITTYLDNYQLPVVLDGKLQRQ